MKQILSTVHPTPLLPPKKSASDRISADQLVNMLLKCFPCERNMELKWFSLFQGLYLDYVF